MEKHTIYLAGGCFWGMEAFMRQLPGVLEVRAGYANGHTTTAPTYEAVCRPGYRPCRNGRSDL